MPFQFHEASCIAVGTFNMYIIQPRWLTNRGVISGEADWAVQSNLSEPGLKFWSPGSTQRWSVNPTRLAVATEGPDDDCGRPLAQVLGRLPETPLKAVGNNFRYTAPKSELDGLRERVAQYRPGRMPKGVSLVRGGYHVTVQQQDDPAELNLQLTVDHAEDRIVAMLNAHTSTGADLGEANDQACAAAKRFESHRSAAEDLIKSILGGKVTHGAHDA